MEFVDHVFILLLFVVQPVHGYFESRRLDARTAAGERFDRVLFYRQTAAVEWAFLAALMVAWFVFQRPVSQLGFVMPGGAGFWGGAVLLALLTGYLVYFWRWAKQASNADKTKQLESLGKVIRYLPQTFRELRNFVGVSITAGIVEEIVYRGFVLWYLAQLMPLWVAVVASSVFFGLGHSYQGASGAFRCGLLGLAFGIFYVVTGSIWLPILAHIVLDALQGAAILELTQKDDEKLRPEPA